MNPRTVYGLLLVAAGIASMAVEYTTRSGRWHGWELAWNYASLALALIGLWLLAPAINGWRERHEP